MMDTTTSHGGPADPQVRRLHQILLWPLRLMPQDADEPAAPRRPWELLLADSGQPWREVQDEYTGDTARFHERHYQEFVTFLPFVQRFLYGNGHSGEGGMKVLRRHDVAQLRLRSRPQAPQLLLDVVHVDLYFFFDVDVVLLNVELACDEIALSQAQDLMYRLGRAYPSGWDAQGQPLHTLAEAEWLGHGGEVLACSDSAERERFLAHVGAARAPRLSAHWDWLLRPLACEHAEGPPGLLRFRQIEYYRMPTMVYLALDAPEHLSDADFTRLALISGPSDGGPALSELHHREFEQHYCYDRLWHGEGAAPFTRYLCCGHGLVVVGRAGSAYYSCRDRGVLAQFRHQHFLVFLITHFQKAALLMFSDRLVEALRRLDVNDTDNVRRFKRAIRSVFESFLRFSHRYWFRAVAEQYQTRALHRLCVHHLELQPLFDEVKARVSDMSSYLETDSIRRQANTVVRLTVVTIFGMVGTITTGFLGMNLLAEAESPLWRRLLFFALTMVATVALTIYTMAKSKRLSDFLDALSDERMSMWQKTRVFFSVWRSGR